MNKPIAMMCERDGTEQDNDVLVDQWPKDLVGIGVPVWHLHESLKRLRRLCESFSRVALGSSGDFATVGTSHCTILLL